MEQKYINLFNLILLDSRNSGLITYELHGVKGEYFLRIFYQPDGPIAVNKEMSMYVLAQSDGSPVSFCSIDSVIEFLINTSLVDDMFDLDVYYGKHHGYS